MEVKPFIFLRSNLSLLIRIATVVIVPAVVYAQDLRALANEALQSELASYTLAIPFLIAYVLYRKRRVLKATFAQETKSSLTGELAGLILCLVALMVYLYGSYSFNSFEFHLVSLPFFVAGCVLILFGASMLRELVFPLGMLFLIAIPPLEIVFLAGAQLSNVGSQVSFAILRAIGLPVDLSSPNGSPVLALTTTSGAPIEFAVAVACSGVYSLLGFTVFVVFAAYLIRGPLWKKAILFIAGFPLIFASNIARLTLIVSIGYWFGNSLAMNVFHLFGGWALILISTLVLLLVAEKILKLRLFTAKTKPESCSKCGDDQKNLEVFCSNCGKFLRLPSKIKLSNRDAAKILTLLMSAVLITFVQVPTFTVANGPAEVVLQTPHGLETAQMLPNMTGYNLRFMFRDRSFEALYGIDAALIYTYVPTNGVINPSFYWVALEVSKARGPLHDWDVCNSANVQSGHSTVLDNRETQLLQNPAIVARFYSQKTVANNLTTTYLFWYTRAVFDNEWKYIKISVFAETTDPESFSRVENLLLPFGRAIAEYWQPIQSSSLAGFAVTRDSPVFLIVGVSLPTILLFYAGAKKRNAMKLNGRVYSRLSNDDKLVIQAVNEAAGEGRSTTHAVALKYKNLSACPIQQPELLERLNYAEEAGLIRQSFVNDNDYPILAWKPTFKVKG